MQLITSAIMEIINGVLSILPQDPFIQFINEFSIPYINVVNYFVPFGTLVNISYAWITAISIFYLYQVFLRYVGAIGS